MKMLSPFLWMFAASVTFGASGNVHTNYSGIFALHESEADYMLLLSGSVFAGYRDIAPVSYAEMPAFAPEMGFWLLPGKADYFVVWTEATTNLWGWAGFGASEEDRPLHLGRSRKELVELANKEGIVKFHEGHISPELGERIVRCWQKAVLEDRPPAPAVGLDGTTMIFGASAGESNTAFWKVWSPSPGSKADRLMKLAYAIRLLILEKNDADLRRALTDLEKVPIQSPEPTASGRGSS